MSGRNPPSYCTLTLIAMQGHQQKGRQNNTSSNNKDKSNPIIETSTAEDHDDENLHNPETVQDAVIHLEVDELFGHGFDKLVCALLCGGDTKFKMPKAGNGNVFFPNKRMRFARADKKL